MQERLTPEESRMVETARRFAADVVAPNAADWELQRRMPVETLREAAAAGLCGLLVPQGHGGAGLGCTAMARVMEELAAADMAFAFSLVVHNNLAASLCRHGEPRQIDRYLPDMLSGRRVGAFLLTEARGGSDAAAIATRAGRDGEGWRLDGEKAWITNAANADILSVYAQTDPDQGWRGIATFLVDADQPGVVREAPYSMLGGHAAGTGSFRFEGCRLDAGALFIPPGAGFKAAMAGIDLARITVGAMCCGMLRRGLEIALDYAVGREAFGRRLADFQGLQWMLADVATDLEAARLLTYDAAARIDAGEDASLAAAHAKKFATRITLKGLADCMQALGANGFSHDQPLARHLAAAKMAQYLDGTTEIQNVVISRALLGGREQGGRKAP